MRSFEEKERAHALFSKAVYIIQHYFFQNANIVNSDDGAHTQKELDEYTKWMTALSNIFAELPRHLPKPKVDEVASATTDEVK